MTALAALLQKVATASTPRSTDLASSLGHRPDDSHLSLHIMSNEDKRLIQVVRSFDALADYQLGPVLLCPAGYPIDLWAPPPSPQGSLTGKFPRRPNTNDIQTEARHRHEEAPDRGHQPETQDKHGGTDVRESSSAIESNTQQLNSLVLPHDVARAVRWTLHVSGLCDLR